MSKRRPSRFACWHSPKALRARIDRKQTEEALRRSEELFRAIVEDQTEMIVRWKPDGTRTFVNRAYCRTFGQTDEALVGNSFLPLVVEPYLDTILQKIRSITPEHPIQLDTHESLLPDGTTCWQEWSDRGIFDEKGKLIELQSVGRDITERKRAEQELRRLLERLNLAKNAAGLGVWDWDVVTGEVVWDDRMYELYRRKKDAPITYQEWLRLLHPAEEERLRKSCRRSYKTGKTTTPSSAFAAQTTRSATSNPTARCSEISTINPPE